jgi:ADP-ribose pyrophosphatase YjhB (NUDIX family)
VGDSATGGSEAIVSDNGQVWRVSWHPPPDPPPGTPHGAAAICIAGGQVVLVSSDGQRWGLPGGRPEPQERWTDTLVREVWEEACAQVTASRLLGFTRGECLSGREQRLVLVRSLWRAEVHLESWQPRFEITHRRLVPPNEALRVMTIEAGMGPIYRRMFVEAAITDQDRHHRPTR